MLRHAGLAIRRPAASTDFAVHVVSGRSKFRFNV
jgi:hypothetical protein